MRKEMSFLERIPPSYRRIRNRRLRRRQEQELRALGEVRTVYVRDLRGWF